MKIIRIVVISIGVYVGLGLVFDGAIAYFQPQSQTTAVRYLMTYAFETRSSYTVHEPTSVRRTTLPIALRGSASTMRKARGTS